MFATKLHFKGISSKIQQMIINYLIFLLFICPTNPAGKPANDYSVAVEILEITKNEEVKLKVEVTNLSYKAASVLKFRRQSYKEEKIKALGNYVIEIQKFENNRYNLFTPSADIDPVFENQEYVLLQKGDSIVDTLYVEGSSFSRGPKSKGGFPSGKYRMKIYFNPDMWNCNEKNGSKWAEFKIE